MVLFDEIEKAHNEIYNTLLQVLEDGRLTDGQGRTVDFKNTVLIFTSNLGTSDISKAVGLGFTSGGGENNYERMKQKVNDELKKHFRPEFLNRIDDIIVFHQLTRDEIIQMVDLMVGRVSKQLKSKDMDMESRTTPRRCWPSGALTRSWVPVHFGAPSSVRSKTRYPRRSSRGGRSGANWSPSTWRTGTGRPGENAKFTFVGGPRRETVEPDLAAAATE